MATRHEHLIPWFFFPGTTAYRIFTEAMTLAECGGIVERLDDADLDLVDEIHMQMAVKREEACHLAGCSFEEWDEACSTLIMVWCIGERNKDKDLAANLFAEAGLSV